MKKRSVAERALVERMKELDCLYGISRLFSHRSLGLEKLLREIVGVIPRAWQYPARTCARILYDGREYRSRNYSPRGIPLAETIERKHRSCGSVEVFFLGDGAAGPRVIFLEDEKKLLKAIAELLGNIVEKKQAEMSLRQTTRELRRQKGALQNKNIALREIISQVELEKKALQDRLRMDIELAVFPLLDRMMGSDLPPDGWKNCLSVVRQNLEGVTSAAGRKSIEDRAGLSPRELEICNLIGAGQSNKLIAELLRISPLTVERHRHNIRRKLHIDNERINLATFLRCR